LNQKSYMNATPPAAPAAPATSAGRLLGRHLTLAVAVKLVALAVIYFLFFAAPQRAAVDIVQHIAGPAAPAR
jgi:hypothetical protein